MINIPCFLRYSVLAAVVMAFSNICPAVVLLDDSWADASCVEPNLPDESPVWVGYSASGGGGVTMNKGALVYKQGTSSEKMWTYFRSEDNPISLAIGDQLIATIEFIPRSRLYDNSSRGFRFGLFNDPTNGHILSNTNKDSGGSSDPWTDATGYGVQIALSSGLTQSETPSIGKRTDLTNANLMGSGDAWTLQSGGNLITNVLDTRYTLTLKLDRIAENQMRVTFGIADDGGTISTYSILDDPLGTAQFGTEPIDTKFDQLFFRFSSADTTADTLEFNRFKVEYIPKPGE